MISLLALASLGAGAQNLQKGDYGYLYCHMSGRGEWTAYALSRDGVHFHDLIDGDPVYNVEEMSKIYNPQIEMFARFKMKSSFHKTKRII